MRPKYFFYLCLVSILLLSGCGFKLRGAEKLVFKQLYIDADPQAYLTFELRRAVRFSHTTKLANSANEADAILQIISNKRERQVISLNSQGQAIEYRLIQQLEFSVRNHQQQFLIPPTQLALSRDLTYSDAAVLAKEVEAEQLYKNMDEDMAQQIMRRLATVTTLAPVQQPTVPSEQAPLLPTK